MNRGRALAAVLVAGAVIGLGSVGCSTDRRPPPPTDLGRYVDQSAEWTPCPSSDEYLDTIPSAALCTSITVPVDYFNETSGRGNIEIALIRIPAVGESHGNLLVNPGGPGESGFDTVAQSAEQLQSHLPGFDIVGFDPRGVSRSAGFDCEQPLAKRLDQVEDDFTPEDKTEFDRVFNADAEYDQACRDHNPIWGFLGTSSVARDVYVISRALGDPGINFYGISYGSVIGYELLRTYPDHIGRMILESPVDPSQDDPLPQQMAAFNTKLEGLLADCAADATCGQGGTKQQVRQKFLAAARNIEDPANRTLTDDGHPSETLVYHGLIIPFYLEWNPALQKAYLGALGSMINEHDARNFEYWGYLYDRYDPSAHKFTSTDDILSVVRCLDVSKSTSDTDIAAERSKFSDQIATIGEDAPLFHALAFSDAYLDDDRAFEPCSYAQEAYADQTIPDPLPEAAPVSNPGSVPVLLLGVTGDAATPYEWARTVAANLAVPLVSQNTSGHGVYLESDNACTIGVVDTYLASGEVPASDTTC